MSRSRHPSGDRYVWYGAVTIGVVAATAVWTLRLLWPQAWEIQPACSTVLAFLAVAILALGGLYRSVRTWAVLGIGAPVVLAVAGFAITDAPGRPSLVVLTLAGFAGVSLLVAHQWSNRWMRLTVIVLAVSTLGLTLRSGRAEIDDLRLRQARATAASLAGDATALSAAAQSKANSLPAAAEAYDRAERALVERVGSDEPEPPRPGGCPQTVADTVDRALCDLAPMLREALSSAGRPAPADLTAVSDQLAALLAAEDLSDGDRALIGVFAEASEAIEAAISPPAAPAAAVEAATASIEDLCEAAGGVLVLATPYPACDPPVTPKPPEEAGAADQACPCPSPDQAEPTDPPPSGEPDDARDLAVLVAQAERQVAAARLAISGTEGDTEALAEAEASLATAVAEKGDPAPDHSLATLVTAGGERLARSVPGIGGDRVPLGLGQLGWGLLGGLVLLGYRQLEILNRDRSRGLVKINRMVGAGDDTTLDSAFRRHVLSNVAEPGTLPGATTPLSITDLFGAGDVKKVVAAISAITAVTPGFELDATYQGPPTTNAEEPEGSDGDRAVEPERSPDTRECHRVFIRVRKARTGATLKTKLVTAPTAVLAVRSAGYWGAAYILSRDSTAPGWSRWSEASALKLAEYDEVIEVPNYDRTDAEDKLRQALAVAPASGLLLATLASKVELAGRRVEALELHIRAATQHPRNPQARYRLAMSLSNLAADPEQWTRTPVADQRRVLRALPACQLACGVAIEPSPAPGLVGLLHVAEGFRKATLRLLERRQVAVLALRRSERRYWAPMLFASDQRAARRRTHQTMASSGHVLWERRRSLEEAPDPGSDVSDTDMPDQTEAALSQEADEALGWQTLYNLACFRSVRSSRTGPDDRRPAVELLERILFEMDAGGQLTAGWVDSDPDLDNLRSDTRFIAFQRRLPDQPDSDDRQEER